MLLSVIVPCYNEEAVVAATYERLSAALNGMEDADYELIFVDDGSRDNTFGVLSEIQSHDKRAKVLRLSRNFGHQIAFTAGLEVAAGDAVVVIDADLQDPPEIIPEMVRLWRSGNHVVYGSRASREGESRFKLMTAKAFYRLINRMSETQMPLDTGDFRLMDRKVVEVLLAMPERARFLRGMVTWAGFQQVPLAYNREPRQGGRSKYPLLKMIQFAMDGIISFSVLPLRLATMTGFITICLAIIGIIVAVIDRLFGFYDLRLGRGWASLFVAVLFIGGVQLLSLGMIGEYLGRIYTEVKRRPLYAVQERLGFEVRTQHRAPEETAKERAHTAF